ncbi:uncharacterized protein LOC124530509 [Vanessa cardui]|uniref:uncharacterized protein LOC124530509 n=1 Tax=Vanessa cardui TaxID=171605 RepID=UPI001F1327EF|nr:uncharacterized protein LOC124530509 [Vanessa cardui]
MSNRKESLKKSLGLTEYPWSSDDEDNPQTNPEPAASSSRRQAESENPNQPGPSGHNTGGPSLSISPSRRNQTRLERDLFWSLLNNPNRMSGGGPMRPSTSSAEPVETHERIDLDSPVSNIQRILAIKRLTRSLGANLCKHPQRPGPGSSRNIIFTPTMHGDYSSLKFGRFKRRPMTRVPPAGCTRNSIIPAVIESASAPTHSDEESPQPLNSASPEHNDDNAEDQETMEVDTSAGGVSLEEEIVEIDGAGEENQDENGNEEEQVEQASGDEDGHEVCALLMLAFHFVNLYNDFACCTKCLRNTLRRERDCYEISAQVTAPAESQQPQGVKRKGEIPEEREPDSVKEFNQSLLRLLECPVCLEWMEPPMSQCRRGHLVCGRCRARLAACPVCRTAFSSVRNRAMEAVAEMLRYPCRHGCGRDTRLRRRAAHEASCAARRYRCPAPPCAERAPLALADLPHHFQTKHLSMLKVGRKHKFSMKVNSEQHDNWLVMAARELFHLRVDVDIRTWGVVVYVAYIGPKCNASNYTYEVTVTGQHNDRKLVYTRATHSDLESSSLNVSRQDCFHLTLDQALNFLRFKNRYCEPDKFLDFVVEINKRDVPVETPLDESDS